MGDTTSVARAVPRFAASFPRHPALDILVDAFARGDYRRVRRDAPALMGEGTDDDVRAAAAELLRRTRPDPLAGLFFGLPLALLVFLAVYWWARAGGR